MSSLFPIPRSTRRQDFVAAAGQAAFGVAGFAVYDPADLRVRVRAAAGSFVTLATGAWSAVLSGPAPSTPTVTLVTPRALGDVVRIEGARTASRTTDVTLAGIIRGASLETELDKIALTQQELRRDFDDLIDALDAANASLLTLAVTLPAFIASLPSEPDGLGPGQLWKQGSAAGGYVPVLTGTNT